MTDAQRQAVIREAKTWLKTPFHHDAQLKRIGVDCGHFVRLAYNNALGLKLPEPPKYSSQWNMHRSDELYLHYVEQYAEPVEAPQMADLLVFQVGRTFSHGCLLMEDASDLVIHAMQGHGVCYANHLQYGQLRGKKYKAYTLMESTLCGDSAC